MSEPHESPRYNPGRLVQVVHGQHKGTMGDVSDVTWHPDGLWLYRVQGCGDAWISEGSLEGYLRPAQTALPGGKLVQRPWQPSERYQLFARGFRDGAGTRSMRKDHMGLGAYDRGYAQGVNATRSACAAFAAELGHQPSVLRSATPVPAESNGEDKRERHGQ